MHASMYVQIWVAVDRQFGCKDFRASETTALHWPVWHDVCCDRPWWRDRCPRPYCCRCPVESIGTCQLHTLHTACRGWNLQVPGPEITGRFLSLFQKNCLESATSTRYDRYEYIWGLFLKISRNSILSRSCYHLKYPIYKRFHWNSNISLEVD